MNAKHILFTTCIRSIIVALFLVAVSGVAESEVRERKSALPAISDIRKGVEGEITAATIYERFRKYNAVDFALRKSAQEVIIHYLRQIWSVDTWADDAREIWTYDTEGRVVEDLFQIYVQNDWVDIDRFLYEYDVNGNLIVDLLQEWIDDEWIDIDRFLYSHYPSGDILESVFEEWDGENWTPLSKTEYFYTESGQFDELLEYFWGFGDWEPDTRLRWEYDVQGNALLLSIDLWEDDEWREDFRFVHTYDSGGNLLTEIWEYFDAGEEEWIGTNFNTFTYDQNGNQIEIVRQIWTDDAWENTQRVESTYDGNNRLVSEISSVWVTNNWVPQRRTSHEYSQEGELTVRLIELWTGSDWLNYQRFLYGGSPTNIAGTGTVPERFELSQNYPNPFNPRTAIRFTLHESTEVVLSVYDVLGREIEILVDAELQPGQHTVTFDAAGLPSGIYVYRIRAGSLYEQNRMILLK